MNLKKNFFKKLSVMTSIGVIFGVFLFAFYSKQDFLNNISFGYFKDVYLPSYGYFYKEKVNNGLVSAAIAFNFSGFSRKDDQAKEEVKKNNAREIPVLNYHGFTEKFDGSNILAEDFKKQMFALKKEGWQTVSMDDLYKFMKNEKEIPEKSFLITFDDGRKDSYYPANPILKALNYRAVMFIITSHSLYEDSYYYLTKKEVRTMLGSGRWDIQVHTKDGHDVYNIDELGNKGHFFSNKLWKKDENRIETDEEFEIRIINDFKTAKEDLKKELDIEAVGFAFPFGDYGQETINFPNASDIVLKNIKEIYPLAFYQVRVGDGFTLNYPVDYSDDDKFFMIKRISIRPDWNEKNLLEILRTSSSKSLPYNDNFKEYNGWIREYGNLEMENNNLKISSSETTTGASVFLDGSYFWGDYVFNTTIDWIKGSHISLAARFKDENDYVTCAFSDDNIRIEQKIAGKTRNIVDKKNTYDIPKENLRLGVSVVGDTVRCYVNGNEMAYAYYLSPILGNGGIGIKTWDKELGNSEIKVKNVSVSEIKNDWGIKTIIAPESELPVKNSVLEEWKEKEEARKNKEKILAQAVSSGNKTASSASSYSKSSSSSIKAVAKNLPYKTNVFSSSDEWKNLFGRTEIINGMLMLGVNKSADASTTGSILLTI